MDDSLPSCVGQMLPLTSEQLKVLQEVYPDACPRPGQSLDTIMFKAGQADVVRTLTDHFKHHNKKNGVK